MYVWQNIEGEIITLCQNREPCMVITCQHVKGAYLNACKVFVDSQPTFPSQGNGKTKLAKETHCPKLMHPIKQYKTHVIVNRRVKMHM